MRIYHPLEIPYAPELYEDAWISLEIFCDKPYGVAR